MERNYDTAFKPGNRTKRKPPGVPRIAYCVLCSGARPAGTRPHHAGPQELVDVDRERDIGFALVDVRAGALDLLLGLVVHDPDQSLDEPLIRGKPWITVRARAPSVPGGEKHPKLKNRVNVQETSTFRT